MIVIPVRRAAASPESIFADLWLRIPELLVLRQSGMTRARPK
jgi:hypothetical protein